MDKQKAVKVIVLGCALAIILMFVAWSFVSVNTLQYFKHKVAECEDKCAGIGLPLDGITAPPEVKCVCQSSISSYVYIDLN